MTQKQIRREYVDAVEEKLKRHPLAIFPHYKDHMSPEVRDDNSNLDYQVESRQVKYVNYIYPVLKLTVFKRFISSLQLFDKVVSILDPDVCVNSASALPTRDHVEEGEKSPEPSKEEVHKVK